jgi:hypothetical protein
LIERGFCGIHALEVAMDQDPFAMLDDVAGSLGDFLGDPPGGGVELDFPLEAEPEEVLVLDSEGCVVGVIDLS